ncbi:unnamed protein product, partial [Prorocentrum cordatum]
AVTLAVTKRLGLDYQTQKECLVLDPHSYKLTEEVEYSNSYPGLKSVYRIHQVAMQAKDIQHLGALGLPEGTDFVITRQESNEDRIVLKYGWQPSDDCQSFVQDLPAFTRRMTHKKSDKEYRRNLVDNPVKAQGAKEAPEEPVLKRRVQAPEPITVPARSSWKSSYAVAEMMRGKHTDWARAKNAAKRIRDPEYHVGMFFEDCRAAFPELQLYQVDSATSSGRSGDDEYQRTVGALFAVFWLMRLHLDGGAHFPPSADGGKFKAGVGVIVKANIGVPLLDGYIDSHVLIPGHGVAVYVHVGPRHGFIAVPLYMIQGELLGGSNAEKIRQLGQCLSYYKAPFIVGADWDMFWDKIVQGRLHERLRGTFIALQDGTYRDPKTGNTTMIDYFMASDGLGAVMEDVAEKVEAEDDDDEVQFEVPRGEPSFSWTELMGDDAHFECGTASDQRSRLDGLCKALFDGAEEELLPLFQYRVQDVRLTWRARAQGHPRAWQHLYDFAGARGKDGKLRHALPPHVPEDVVFIVMQACTQSHFHWGMLSFVGTFLGRLAEQEE